MTDLDDPRVDELYQAPLDEFVGTRNRLAATLKKEGAADLAKAVKALRKPSPPAWAVNQLYWKRRELFSALVAAGDRSRRALTNQLMDAVEAETARAEAVKEAVTAARDLVVEHGMKTSDALERRITTTLEALAAYGSLNPQPCQGRLDWRKRSRRRASAPSRASLRTRSPRGPVEPPTRTDRTHRRPRPLTSEAERRAAIARERAELEKKRRAAGAARLERLEAELESLRARALDLEERIGASRGPRSTDLVGRLDELKDLPPRGAGEGS